MAKKKKRAKPSPPDVLSPEEQILLNRLLRSEPPGLQDLPDLVQDPLIAGRLVENVPLHDPFALELLTEIRKAFPQKAVQKAVKKQLFRLKQKGISVPEPEPANSPASSLTAEAAEAYIGPIDGAGYRPVLIGIPQLSSGVDLAMGVLSDEKGIVDFVYERCSRKKMKEIKEIFFSKAPFMVDTSLAHVTTVLERAYSREKEHPGDPAGEYLRLRPRLLQITKVLDGPAASAFVSLGKDSPDMVTATQIERLFHHGLMASWVLAPEKIDFLAESIARAEESPIFITEGQRREHINKLKEDGLTKIFIPGELEIFRERLQETAYVFLKIGEENLARVCLAASLSLEAGNPRLKANPFLNALLERSLAQIPKPEPSSSLILR